MAKQARRTDAGNDRFASVPGMSRPRSVFNRSHNDKTTMDAGYLIPVMVDEALPGDTISLTINSFARLATALKPVMDSMYIDFHCFSIPNRLIYDKWQKMNGEQDDPGDSTDFVLPILDGANPVVSGDIADYMGLPLGTGAEEVQCLPFRAYNLTWKEWFRDENLQDSPVIKKDETDDSLLDYPLRKRGKRFDYFTSQLTAPQKGPAVDLNLGGIVDVVPAGSEVPIFRRNSASTPTAALKYNATGGVLLDTVTTAGSLTSTDTLRWSDPELEADLSSATIGNMNDFRESVALQQLLEADARGGTRYTEQLRVHFGVVSPDQRLQRPEYLGGYSTRFNVHPVAQTGGNFGGDFNSDLSAFVTASNSGRQINHSFTEHCQILVLASVRADLSYQQGIDRMWLRSTRLDHYYPILANLGEDAVLSKEIFADGTAGDEDVFGYQERWAEYRYKPSKVTGLFRSATASGLDIWHLSQDFGTRPVLNDSFIQEDPPVDRVIAVPAEPQYLLDVWFDFKHIRPMPMYSVPGLARL